MTVHNLSSSSRRSVMESLPSCLFADEPQHFSHLDWQDLRIDRVEFIPYFTLVSGQCFNWHRLDESNVWVGVIGNYPLAISQTRDKVIYAVLDNRGNDDFFKLFHSYLQLDANISTLYSEVHVRYVIVVF